MAINKLRGRRLVTAVAGAGIAALTLAACTTTGTEGGDGGTSSGGTVTVGVTNAVTSLNNATPQANLDSNGYIGYLTGDGSGGAALGSLFTLDSDFNIVHDETNASYELVSEDPLTVKYTVKDGAVWSDGEPITTDDLLITWAIASGYYDDAKFDDTTGEVTTGTQYFPLAGSTAGLDTTSFPEIDKDAGTLTLEYAEPYVDWELVNLLGKPAHVLAEEADTTVDDLTQLLTDLPKGDPANPVDADPTLKAVADFWNTGYDITEFPSDDKLLVGAGPYVLTDYTANDGGSATLKLNEKWTGKKPAYDEVILSFINDANAQVTALRNGEVDIITPQPSADTVTALEDANAEIDLGDELSYDHLDLNFGSDVFSNADYREAFLLTVPRQQILDSIVTPINDKAEVLNSQLFVTSQPQYADATAENGYSDYAEPDIDAAKALLNGATPEVTILYNSANSNRVDSFRAIQSSAQQAGFVVKDGGSTEWSSLLSGGDYDASIFGWISPGAGYAALPQIWKTGGGGNYNNYSNAQVDELVDESQTVIDDADRLTEIQIEIDKLSREDNYGLPLFQLPGLDASNGDVDGTAFFAGQTGIFWNILDWAPAE